MGCALFHKSGDQKLLKTDKSSEHPQHEHSVSSYLNIANGYYNQAAAPDVSTVRKLELYELSIENYKKALQVHEIESETKAKIELYIKETEELLAKIRYDAGYTLVPFDADMEKRKTNAPKAIPYFQKIVDDLPNTDYAVLSYVQLGLCYEYLEKWDDAERVYKELISKYTDELGNPITHPSEIINQAIKFARERLKNLLPRMLISS